MVFEDDKEYIPSRQFIEGMHTAQQDVFAAFDAGIARFMILNWHRRARKTTFAINLLIRECIKHPKSRYPYIAPTYKAAKNIVWRDPLMLKQYLPMSQVKRMNESEMFVEFNNGSILSLHGGDEPDALRGINAHGAVVDEAALSKPEVYEEFLRPIIMQDPKRWILFISTPKGKNWFYNLCVKAKNNPEWYINTLNVWTSGIIPNEEILKAKADLPAATFAQELECAFNDNASSVFKGVELCIGGALENPNINRRYVTGVDLARYNDFTVLITVDRDSRRVVNFQRYGNTEWAFQKDIIVDTCNRYNSLAVVDATGVGDPIAEDLARRGISVLPFKIGSESKKEIIKRLQVAIEQRMVTFPGIQLLVDELTTYAYDMTDAGNIRYNAPEGMHDDCVIALALAVSGLKSDMYPKRERKPSMAIPGNSYKQQHEPANAGIGY